MIDLRFDDRQSRLEPQGKDIRQCWNRTENNLARAVVDFKCPLTQQIQANHSIDMDGEGLLKKGEIFDQYMDVVASAQGPLPSWAQLPGRPPRCLPQLKCSRAAGQDGASLPLAGREPWDSPQYPTRNSDP